MLTTVSGDVTYPGVYEVESGISVAQVLALASAGAGAQAILLGGYGGTWQLISAVRLAASALTAFAADLHAHAARRPCRAAQRGPQAAVLPIPPEATEEWR